MNLNHMPPSPIVAPPIEKQRAQTPEAPLHRFQIGGGTAAEATNPLLTSPIAYVIPETSAPAATKPPPKPRKRKPWTTEEDRQLESFIRAKEDPNDIPSGGYAQIAKRLNRTTKQCRDRWCNYLRDGIQKGKWQPEEEELIKDLYQTFGSRWTAMAKLLKNRSANDIKNKWHAMRNKERRRQRSYTEGVASMSNSCDLKPRAAMPPGDPEDQYGLDL